MAFGFVPGDTARPLAARPDYDRGISFIFFGGPAGCSVSLKHFLNM